MATIRTARVDERAALEALQLRASLVWDEYREDLLAHPDAIEIDERHLAEGRARVVELDGVVAGFSLTLPGERDCVELDGLFVEPDRMRHGLGAALIEDAVARARSNGAVAIEVTGNPGARTFYERLGFVEIATVATRFGPAIRLRRTL
jgi:GNAT superfamily N-acetyltransferase